MVKISQSSVLRPILAHSRLYISVILGMAVALFVPLLGVSTKATQAILGYDASAVIYLVFALWVMVTSTRSQMRKRALVQDDGKYIALALVVIALLFSMGAIFVDLAEVKNINGPEKYARVILAVTTIIASWVFTHLVFALHYAHDYYSELQRCGSGGLVFLPAEEEPDYLDFLYFSFVLGATAQTADVTIASKKIRRICLAHSILAFFFNTTLLALTINMASGLF